jgi:microtubule-associated protein-like 6
VGRGEYRGYLGHAPGVSNVCFSHNDEFLITTGANDRCAFQWRHYETDEGDEEMTSEVEEECLTAVEDYEDFAVSNQVVKMVVVGKSGGIPVYAPADALDAKVSISHPPQSASAIAHTRLTLSC